MRYIILIIPLFLYSLDFRSVTFSVFSDFYSKRCNKNIYLDKDVNATISLYVPDDVSCKDLSYLFSKTIKDKNLEVSRIGSTYFVKRKKDIKKDTYVISLKYDSFSNIQSYLNLSHVEYKYLNESNSIVLHCSKKFYNSFLKRLKSLDRPTSQIYLRFYLLEVSNNNLNDVGFNWGTYSQNINGDVSLAMNTIIGTFSQSYTNFSKLTFYTALKLLNDKKVLNVKQFPLLLVKNNKRFVFDSVQNIPYLNTVTKTEATNYSEQTALDYKDVGLKISGKAMVINDYVSLDLDLTIEDLISLNDNMPLTYKRHLMSSSNLKSGQILLLSGLKRDKISNRVTKVPFLSSIPFIKYLFIYHSKEKDVINMSIAVEIINVENVSKANSFAELATQKGSPLIHYKKVSAETNSSSGDKL